MNKIIFLLTLSLFALPAFADETVGEKIQDTSNDITREATAQLHRLEEAACTESETECMAKKAKHRAQEAKEAIKDKAAEWKNILDN